MREVIIWYPRETLEMPVRHSVLVAGYMKYDYEKEYTYFVDIGVLTDDGTIETCNDWREGQQIFNIEYWAYLPSYPLIPSHKREV